MHAAPTLSSRRHHAERLWAARTLARLQARALAKLHQLLKNPKGDTK